MPGDVLLAINGRPPSRPERLQTVWDSLRTRTKSRRSCRCGDQKLELYFTIEPPVH